MWDLPGSGIEPVSSALAGGFLTPEPPEKPLTRHFIKFCLPELSGTPISSINWSHGRFSKRSCSEHRAFIRCKLHSRNSQARDGVCSVTDNITET